MKVIFVTFIPLYTWIILVLSTTFLAFHAADFREVVFPSSSKNRLRGKLPLFLLKHFLQPKEKRVELRKHIQQRKRKSLSDLFKTLSSIGKTEISSVGLQ